MAALQEAQLSAYLVENEAEHEERLLAQEAGSRRFQALNLMTNCYICAFAINSVGILVDQLHADRFWRGIHFTTQWAIVFTALAMKRMMIDQSALPGPMRSFWHKFSPALCVLVLKVGYQTARGVGEARRCWGSGNCELDFTSFPPQRACVDLDPWKTAQLPVEGQAQEDHGCEGRYNGGFGLSGACSFLLFVDLSDIPWQHAMVVSCAYLVWYATVACFVGAHADHSFPRALMLLIALSMLTVASIKDREEQVQQSKDVVQRMRGHKRRIAEVLSTLIPEEVFRQVVWLSIFVDGFLCLSVSLPVCNSPSRSFCRLVKDSVEGGYPSRVFPLSLARPLSLALTLAQVHVSYASATSHAVVCSPQCSSCSRKTVNLLLARPPSQKTTFRAPRPSKRIILGPPPCGRQGPLQPRQRARGPRGWDGRLLVRPAETSEREMETS